MLEKIAKFSYKNAKSILILFSILMVTSPWFLKDLRIESTQSVVINDDPLSRIYQKTTEIFGDSVPLVIFFRKEKVSPKTMNSITDKLWETISSWEDIRYVDTGPVNLKQTPLAKAILRSSLINSSPDILTAFTDKFTANGMKKALQRTRKKLLAASNPDVQAVIAADVLNLRDIFQPIFEERLGKLKISSNSPYYDSEDNNHRLIFIYPQGLSEDIQYSRKLIDRVRYTVRETIDAHPQAAALQFQLSGKYAQSTEATQILQWEMRMISLLACLFIIFLLALVLRSFRLVVIAFFPLLAALVCAFLFARLFFNPLNPVAIMFAAILLGLGIDVMIHCAGRFFQLSEKSPSMETAACQTVVDCGPPVTIGMATTAAAFACLVFADVKALSGFGILTACGILIVLAVSLFLFPAMVRVVSPTKNHRKAGLRFQILPQTLFEFSRSRPYIALGLGLFLFVGSLFIAKDFRFEMDLYKGLPDKMESLQTAREIAKAFGVSLTQNTQLYVEAKDYETAMAFQQILDEKLASLAQEGRITSFLSPSKFAVYPDQVRNRKAQLHETTRLVKQNHPYFETLLDELRFKKSPHLFEYYKLMESLVTPDDIPIEDWAREVADMPLAGKNIRFGEGKVHLQTYVWPVNDEKDFSVAMNNVSEFQAITPPPGVSFQTLGTMYYFEHMNNIVRSDFFRVSGVSLIAVTVLVFFFFRTVPQTLLALIPLTAAIPLTFAVLHILGLSFTPPGIGLIAMVIGIGIDDAVHILARTKNADPMDHNKIIKSIAPVLTLTTVSTTIGFGALLLSRFYSVRMIGLAVAIGVLSSLLFTMLFLPSLTTLCRNRHFKRIKFLLPLFIIMAAFPLSKSFGQDATLDDILTKLQKRYEATDSLTCRYTQTKLISQLVGKFEFTGKIIFHKPHSLYLELRGDENLNLHMDEKAVRIEDLDLDEEEIFPINTVKDSERLSRIIPPLISNSIDQLREKYDITLLPKQDNLEIIELTPKTPSQIAYIRFALGPFSKIDWMKTTYTNGDYTETQFYDWKKLPGRTGPAFNSEREGN